jgi:thiol-disulfide isomerase/thioredoxin
VLIEFWASWCPSCKALEPQLQRIARTHGAKVKLLGVAVSVNQTPQRARLYAQKYKLPMQMLWDAQGKATEAYDAPATSYVVLVDRAGRIVYTGQGGDQDLVGAVRRCWAGRRGRRPARPRAGRRR